MAKRVLERRGSLGADFKKRSRRRREDQHRSADAEEVRAQRPRRNDLRPRLRMLEVPIAELRGASRQVHKKDEAHILQIMASLEGLGVSAPIIVTADYEIVDGHATAEAARRLRIEALPCVIIDHLPDQEIRVLRLALNRIPQDAIWDLDAIELEMQELIDLDAPIELSGTDKLSPSARRASLPFPNSGGFCCGGPGVVSQTSQGAEAGSGHQMGLEIERVVDRTVAGQETLG